MSFIVVMAELIPKEGAEEKLIPLAEALVEATLKEEGNIGYKCLRSITDGTFTFVEEWESVESADLAKDMEIKVLSAEEVNLYE